MNISIRINGESVREVKARRFAHYVDGVRYWFAYHDSIDTVGKDITHIDSGNRVAHIPLNIIPASLNDVKAAAKRTIDQLVETHGAARVAAVLNSTPKLEK